MNYELIEGNGNTLQNVSLYPHEWQHLCILFQRNISIILDEEEYLLQSMGPLNLQEQVEVLFGTYDMFSRTAFSGLIADARVYWRILNKKELSQVSILADDTTDYYVIGTKELLNSSDISTGESRIKPFLLKKEDLLKRPPTANFYLESLFASCELVNENCKRFGGSLPSANIADDMIESIHEYSSASMSQISNFWVLKSPNEEEVCMKGSYNDIQATLQLTNVRNPEKTQLKGLCILPKSEIFSFKVENLRFLFSIIPNTNLVWEDYRAGVQMEWSPKDFSASVYAIDNPEKILYSLQSPIGLSGIIGRKMWFSGNKEIVVAFSRCSNHQFTCDSGSCADLNNICDFYNECEDNSDESFCDVLIDPHHGYNKLISPLVNRDGTQFNVSLHFKLVDVEEVSLKTGTMKMLIEMTLFWVDPRLEFKNLMSNGTIYVDSKNAKKIWNPPIVVPEAVGDTNAFHMGNKVGRVYVSRSSEGRPSFYKGYEGKYKNLDRHRRLIRK